MFITNKNIETSLVRSLQNSFTSQSNCEITLMCDGKTLKCHRHVLVLHSTHFGNLFKDQNHFPTAIAVVNMKYAHLKAMVDYMYFGKIKLQEDSEEMQQIIKCAGDLGLTALVNFITEYLKTVNKAKQMNGNHSANDMNGDADLAMKRKRASDATARVNMDSSFKKPKITDGPLSQSTPLRDNKSINKSNSCLDVKSLDNSESLIIDKKRKSDDDEADDDESKVKRTKENEEAENKRKIKEDEERQKKKQEEELKRKEEERKRKDEEEKKRREEEKQRQEEERRRKEEERRKKAEEEKRKAEEEAKRKAEEAERVRAEEEKKRKEAEKKKEEEAKKAEEEKNKKEQKCDESASSKSCAVCNKQYKDNIDHRKVLDGVQFEKKCIMANCSKPLKFRRSLIDHLLKEHKIDVCDG